MNFFTKSLLILFTLLCFQAQAQMRFGLKGGLNLASQSLSKSTDPFDLATDLGFVLTDNTLKLAPYIGIIGDVYLDEFFSLQTGAFYSGKGIRFRYVETNPLGNFKLIETTNIHYAEIPFSVVYKVPAGESTFRLGAGIYGSYAFAGNYKLKGTVAGESETLKEDIQFGDTPVDDFRVYDAGFTFELGLEANQGILSVAYNTGTQITNGALNTHNTTINFSIAYMLGASDFDRQPFYKKNRRRRRR